MELITTSTSVKRTSSEQNVSPEDRRQPGEWHPQSLPALCLDCLLLWCQTFSPVDGAPEIKISDWLSAALPSPYCLVVAFDLFCGGTPLTEQTWASSFIVLLVDGVTVTVCLISPGQARQLSALHSFLSNVDCEVGRTWLRRLPATARQQMKAADREIKVWRKLLAC